MKNELKLLSSFIILSTLAVSFIFSASAWGCGCNPPCGPCQACQNGACVNTCLSSLCLTCVNGQCKSTCNSSLCQICVNGQCQSRCDPATEECVNGQCIPLPRIAYTYDEVGNRISMTDPTGTTSYSYDYLGRLISVTNPDNKTISYQYDASGNRTQLTDPNGNITAYTYDDNNRLTDVNAPAGLTAYQYDSLGNMTQADYPTGTYTEYSYDPNRNWLVSLVNKDPNDDVLSSYSYTCDSVGNRLSVTEADDSNVSYSYDDIYQLTSETRTGTNAYQITYQYDDVGNRTQIVNDGNTTSYTYNINNQLLTEMSPDVNITYAYDDNGSLVSRTDANDANNNASYTWDEQNRLVAVTAPDGNTVYEYDGDGTRISKTQSGVKTKHISDVALPLVQVLMETTDAGAVQATYTYGNDLISMNRADANSYYHYDGLGSTRQLTNSAGSLIVSYTYDSFGNLIASSGAATNAYGFTGEQQFEEADDLVFLRARYYDTAVGRFISRDPILEPMRLGSNFVWFLPYLIYHPQDLYSYVYVANNPINQVDPLGLKKDCIKKCKENFEWDVTVCYAKLILNFNPIAFLKCWIKAYADNINCVADCCD